MGENIACCIDLLYISAALCSRTQSSGQAPDSRREPSVSKFSSQMAKYCSSSHNRWSIYVTDQLASLPPRSPLMERLHLLSPVPLWLNRPHFACRALQENWISVCCSDHNLHLCPPLHAFMVVPSARALSWGHVTKNDKTFLYISA